MNSSESFEIKHDSKHPLNVGIVIPVYMESSVVEQFHALVRETIDTLPDNFTIYYVNDGSTDNTDRYLQQIASTDPHVRIISLVRNFGHQAALTAGLDIAEGDVVISMDGDGQHPPTLIPQMLNLYRAGYDVVQTQRLESNDDGLFKRISSSAFYWIINKMANTEIIPGTADFRLLSREAVNSLKRMPEYHRFLRGMIPWMGFNTVLLPFRAPNRLGGKSKYSLKKMVKLAEDAVFSFSLTPMRVAMALGLVFLVLAMAEIVYTLVFWLSGRQGELAPGWSSLMFMILINSALLLINFGTMGLYIGYIFQEVKRRPIYLVKEPQSSENTAKEPDCTIREVEI